MPVVRKAQAGEEGARMTDIDMTKLCAEAIGMNPETFPQPGDDGFCFWNYDPLYNDAQAMALVKKLGLVIEPDGAWGVTWISQSGGKCAKTISVRHSPDLNRAIVECVAKMQAARKAAV